MYKPREIHWKGALRILTYIKKSPAQGLYKRHKYLRIEVFSDSNSTREKRENALLANALMLQEFGYLKE